MLIQMQIKVVSSKNVQSQHGLNAQRTKSSCLCHESERNAELIKLIRGFLLNDASSCCCCCLWTKWAILFDRTISFTWHNLILAYSIANYMLRNNLWPATCTQTFIIKFGRLPDSAAYLLRFQFKVTRVHLMFDIQHLAFGICLIRLIPT